MLFSIFIGLAAAAVFFFRSLVVKMKFLFSGGRAKLLNESRIPFLIFSDNRRYWNVFGPVCREFERREIPVEYWTASPDDPALKEDFSFVKCRFIGEGNKAFVELNMVNAGIVLSTTPGLQVYQWKRSRDALYYVYIRHAVDDITACKVFGIDHYDACLLTGSFQAEEVRALEKLRSLPEKDLEVVGQPYMDEMMKRLEAAGPLEKKGRTVLLAPSWGKSGILMRYGRDILLALKATGYRIVVRPHPQSYISEKEMMAALTVEFPEGELFSWNRDNDNFEVLREADIMVTDFSGIIFDYTLVFDNPLIYADTSFDPAPHDAGWLSEPMWKFSILPELGWPLKKEDFPRLREVIDSAVSDETLSEGRRKAREAAWQYRGEAARRTVDYLQRKQKELMLAGTENPGQVSE